VTKTNVPFAQAAERLIAFEAGGTIHNVENAIAVATRIHKELLQHLSPVIGENGFQVLFARTVRLTKPRFPGMHELPTDGPSEAVLEHLCAFLKKQAPTAVTDIVTALLFTFISLLSTFIGEGLTSRLLRNAWPEVLPTEPDSGETP
jgi:hypothetical protein